MKRLWGRATREFHQRWELDIWEFELEANSGSLPFIAEFHGNFPLIVAGPNCVFVWWLFTISSQSNCKRRDYPNGIKQRSSYWEMLSLCDILVFKALFGFRKKSWSDSGFPVWPSIFCNFRTPILSSSGIFSSSAGLLLRNLVRLNHPVLRTCFSSVVVFAASSSVENI